MFVHLNGIGAKAMVDMGATHSCLASSVATIMNLRVEPHISVITLKWCRPVGGWHCAGCPRGGNSCPWVVFVSYQCTDRVNIRQPKPNTNNKVSIFTNPNPTHLLFVLSRLTRI